MVFKTVQGFVGSSKQDESTRWRTYEAHVEYDPPNLKQLRRLLENRLDRCDSGPWPPWIA